MDFCRLTVYQSPSCLNSCGLSCFYSTCSMVLLILFGHCLLNGYCIGLLSHLKPLNYPYFTVKIKKKYFLMLLLHCLMGLSSGLPAAVRQYVSDWTLFALICFVLLCEETFDTNIRKINIITSAMTLYMSYENQNMIFITQLPLKVSC